MGTGVHSHCLDAFPSAVFLGLVQAKMAMGPLVVDNLRLQDYMAWLTAIPGATEVGNEIIVLSFVRGDEYHYFSSKLLPGDELVAKTGLYS